MKFLAFVTLFLASNAFSETLDINLRAIDSVKINCPTGLELEMKNNIGQCVCPAGTWSHYDGEELKCDSLCKIQVGMVGGEIENYCDQGGCWDHNTERYKAVTLWKNDRKILFQERIYSPRQSEVDMLVAEAMTIARTQCDKIIYQDKEVKF
ncbi:MAG: hypothetical protein NDI69_12635 [Bacteriovoracaceae bacterium]|nr:hypothetical protein [Bacteriovoracaceae bacterium]